MYNKKSSLKVGIITVTYNSEKFIEHCINSVALQTYDNLEHLIVDGGSSDRTLKILEKSKNDLFKIISEPDNGIYDAMNKGIKLSNVDIIAFLNSDDFYANNNVIKSFVGEFEKYPDIDACYSDLLYVQQLDITKVVRYWKSENFYPGAFSRGWSPPHPTFFARSSLFDRYGNFDLNYKIAADAELMMRFLEVNKIKTRYLPLVTVKMRIGGTSNKNLKNV